MKPTYKTFIENSLYEAKENLKKLHYDKEINDAIFESKKVILYDQINALERQLSPTNPKQKGGK